jgi:hypothetical protein
MSTPRLIQGLKKMVERPEEILGEYDSPSNTLHSVVSLSRGVVRSLEQDLSPLINQDSDAFDDGVTGE